MAESNNTSSPNVNVIASSASVPTHGQLPPSDEIQDLIMSTQTAPPTDGVFGTTTQTPTAPVTEHHTPVPMNVIVDQSLMGVQPSLGSIETAEDSQEGQSLDRSSLIAPGMSEAMMKLATFWHDQNAEINSMDPTHEGWRTPEMPLARVKKIMRMDEDIKVLYICIQNPPHVCWVGDRRAYAQLHCFSALKRVHYLLPYLPHTPSPPIHTHTKCFPYFCALNALLTYSLYIFHPAHAYVVWCSAADDQC
jgi:hypothetical protein